MDEQEKREVYISREQLTVLTHQEIWNLLCPEDSARDAEETRAMRVLYEED